MVEFRVYHTSRICKYVGELRDTSEHAAKYFKMGVIDDERDPLRGGEGCSKDGSLAPPWLAFG
jgi:hypothetical protein